MSTALAFRSPPLSLIRRPALRALRVDWYVFGAQAALIYGAARVTADVDVTVRLGRSPVAPTVGAPKELPICVLVHARRTVGSIDRELRK